MSCCKYLLKMSFRLISLVKDQVLFTAQFLSVYTVDYMYKSEEKNKAEGQKFYCFKKILYNFYFSGWFVLEKKNSSGPYSRTMYTVWATKLTKHRACSNRELYIYVIFITVEHAFSDNWKCNKIANKSNNWKETSKENRPAKFTNHSMQIFLPFHWRRGHHVTCK